MLYKKLLLSLVLFTSVLPLAAQAQDPATTQDQELFKAKVIKVIEDRIVEDEYAPAMRQQDLLIRGLGGEWKGQEIEVQGISDVVVAESQVYEVGDKVLVSRSVNINGVERFYVIDYVRNSALIWLFAVFAGVVLLIARTKGLRALLVLGATFLIILKFIIPQIIAGANPLLVSVAGAAVILFLAIFATEGFNKKSYVAFAAVALSLLAILGLSWFFVDLAQLSGLAAEEAMYLTGISGVTINLKGLLLAGIIIGALGVLDDVVMSQVSLVEELADANPEMKPATMFKRALKVGTDHINAIVNTLFLAYAGVALPLLVLFTVYDSPHLTLEYILNGELIATEIVRTLVGSIALILSMPIATWLAVRFFAKRTS